MRPFLPKQLASQTAPKYPSEAKPDVCTRNLDFINDHRHGRRVHNWGREQVRLLGPWKIDKLNRVIETSTSRVGPSARRLHTNRLTQTTWTTDVLIECSPEQAGSLTLDGLRLSIATSGDYTEAVELTRLSSTKWAQKQNIGM